MDENITPPPPGPQPGDRPADQPADQPGSHEQPAPGGPRVSGAEMRDVARLRRSTTDKHIAGVAGGLARHLDVDPLLVRIGFVILTIFGGAGILLYGALWLLLPADDGDHAAISLDDRNRSIAIMLAGAIALLAFVGNTVGGFGARDGDGVFFPLVPIAVVGLVVWLVLRRRERRVPTYPVGAPPVPGTDPRAARAAFEADVEAHPEKYRDINSWQFTGDPQTGYRWVRDPRKRGPLLFWIVVPLIALALGVLGVVDLAGSAVSAAAYPALALAIVAGGLLLGSVWGRAGGLILLGLVLAPVTAVATVAPDFEGEKVTYAPTSVAEIPEFGYRLGAGEMVIDLTQLRDPEALDQKVVTASVDLGEIEIIVPDDVTVDASARIDGPGGTDLFGTEGGGIDTASHRVQQGTPDSPTWHIEAEADFGHIQIRSK